MPSDSVVLPATRVPKRLWAYLEELMRRRMLTTRAELIKEALREYVLHHKDEAASRDFRIIEARLALEAGRREDQRREKELLKWIDQLRS